MIRFDERSVRITLWFAAALTAVGAVIFAFPESAIARYYGMPAQVPALYAALTGFVLFLFAGMYAWLALQPDIHRPLLYLGAIGKGGAFVISVALWLAGSVDSSVVTMLIADALFASLWLAWLLKTRSGHGIT